MARTYEEIRSEMTRLEHMPCACGYACPHDKMYDELREELKRVVPDLQEGM